MSGNRRWWTMIAALFILALIMTFCVGIGAFILGFEFGVAVQERMMLSSMASEEQEEIPQEPGGGFPAQSQPVDPTPAPGLSWENPIPFGISSRDDRGMEITVLKVERNVHFEELEPPQDQEFIVVTVRVRNLGTSSQPQEYKASFLRIVGERNLAYADSPPVKTDDDLGEGQLAPGEEKVGKVVRQVGQGERKLVLSWDGGAGMRWLSLE
ncbi:MAG: DUF4352 domain-containing protein [Anaerolineae bacterium]